MRRHVCVGETEYFWVWVCVCLCVRVRVRAYVRAWVCLEKEQERDRERTGMGWFSVTYRNPSNANYEANNGTAYQPHGLALPGLALLVFSNELLCRVRGWVF